MWIGATAAGNVVRFRHDVEERVALLGAQVERELTFMLPDSAPVSNGGSVVASGTPAGDELLARLEAEGMPAGLTGMGFADTGDLWPPWCAALSGGTLVSIAFAARLSPVGAEVGVATAPEARGRGLAAAVTAAWSCHVELAGRACFYTTDAENRSSRRVAERLGLRLLGPTISVP
jgi:GNAT acetyltransferase